MPPQSVDLLQGTLEFLVLKTLSWGALHGFAIARWIRKTTDDALEIEEGALYPALHRMERKGWIESDWGVTENNRRAKYYQITRLGKDQLRREESSWTRYVSAVSKIMAAAARASARSQPPGCAASSAWPLGARPRRPMWPRSWSCTWRSGQKN
jgi:PadR family transcriptional regulator, regulatory protein PadR